MKIGEKILKIREDSCIQTCIPVSEYTTQFLTERIITWIIESETMIYDSELFLEKLLTLDFLYYIPIEYLDEVMVLVEKMIKSNIGRD